MMKTRVKKILAVLLSIAMIIGMVPAMAFADEGDAADEGKTVNLLVFGNSTSSGYGMPDFTNRNDGFASLNNFLEEEYADVEENPNRPKAWTFEESQTNNPNGLSHMSVSAYPWLLKKYIAAEEGVDKVNLMPVTLNGMRTDELRAFIDKDFYKKASDREYAYAQKYIDESGATGSIETYKGFLNHHMGWYFGDFKDSGVIKNRDYDEASVFVQDNIKNADVIVVDLCGNNFGTYMGYRLSAYLGMDDYYRANTYETIDDVEDLPDSLKKNIKSIVSRAIGDNPLFADGAGKQLLDIYMYSVADCIVNFKANMEWINQNKKAGAKVIAVGLNNPMAGLKMNTGDSEIDLGSLAGTLYDLVNRYMKSFDSNTNNYYYAELPSNMTTFASSIADAESLEALLADGTYEDGLGAYAIERIYNDFVKEFMGGTDGDSKVVYSMIQDGIKAQAPNSTFTDWNNLNGDNAKITFDPGTFYLTADNTTLLEAMNEEQIFGAINFSITEPEEGKAFNKNSARIIAAKMAMNSDPDIENNVLQVIASGVLGTDIPADQLKAKALAYLFQNTYLPAVSEDEDAIAQAYAAVQNGVRGQAPNANSFSELSDTECVTFKPGTLYVTYNTQATSLSEAFNYSLTESISEEDQQKGIVLLTKGLIKQITAGTIKPVVQEMLYDAVNKHQDIDIAGLVEILTGAGGMSAAADAISGYIAAKIQGEEADLGAFWGLITIEERFLLSSGVGEHPNAEGCNQKYQAVLDAYLNDNTAYEETKAEVEQLLKELVEMLRKTGARDDIDAIIAKIAQIQDAMEMLDEAQASMEELKEMMELKKQFEEYFQEALDLLGITVDDLIAQGQFIADNVDPVWVAEQIKLMNDIIERWPELQDEYKAKIEEYAEKIADAIDKTIDELIKQKDAFEDSEAMKKIIETIEVLRDVVDKLPKSEEEFKAMLQEQLEKAEAMIEEAAAAISEDLAEQIKEIRKKIEEAIEKEDYQALIDELLPIGEKLLAIGEAVYNLPEYEAAMQEYLEASDAAMAGLEDRVTELERQAGKLLAKSIDVDLVATPKFGAKTSSIDLTWAADEDAAGYILKVDDKEVEAKETEAGLAYEQANIKVAQTYKYEVTPYVLYQVNGETETIYGRTFKKTYVPKVTLKKATLKKVKAATKSFKATWKKITGVDGYQVNYKLGKKAKNKLVKGEKKTSVKIKKLKKGKKYTVKVRVYKTVNGKKYYGKFSKAKKVKVK